MSTVHFRPARPVVTVTLIVLSVIASLPSLASLVGGGGAFVALLIATPGSEGFGEIMRGEVWRLVTPIFVHFGLLHLVFNMMWLWDLGRTLEIVRGRLFVGAFVAVTGVASNVAQYTIAQSANFGGMSGVVYAMLGYVWMQGRMNPGRGIALHPQTVVMMLVWYVLCWTGILGPIANWAHTAGLVIGVAWGALDRRAARS
jgi:membrane associated rhomboid family serine protease